MTAWVAAEPERTALEEMLHSSPARAGAPQKGSLSALRADTQSPSCIESRLPVENAAAGADSHAAAAPSSSYSYSYSFIRDFLCRAHRVA